MAIIAQYFKYTDFKTHTLKTRLEIAHTVSMMKLYSLNPVVVQLEPFKNFKPIFLGSLALKGDERAETF